MNQITLKPLKFCLHLIEKDFWVVLVLVGFIYYIYTIHSTIYNYIKKKLNFRFVCFPVKKIDNDVFCCSSPYISIRFHLHIAICMRHYGIALGWHIAKLMMVIVGDDKGGVWNCIVNKYIICWKRFSLSKRGQSI